MRLIDADECTSVETLKAFPVFEESGANVADLKELIISCKTVNAVLVAHGKWIKSDIPCEKYNCSVCGGAAWYYAYLGEVPKSRFCPNCGARMDLK